MSIIQEIPTYEGIGVYALIDDCGKMYIGSSRNIRTRIKAHESAIKRRKAPKKILEAVSEGHTFHCNILEKLDYGVSTYDLRERELHYIKEYNSDRNGYNSARFYSSGKEQTAKAVKYYEDHKPSGMSGYVKDLYAKLSAPIQAPPPNAKVIHIRVADAFLGLCKSHSKNRGESLNDFIVRAINETIIRDNEEEAE